MNRCSRPSWLFNDIVVVVILGSGTIVISEGCVVVAEAVIVYVVASDILTIVTNVAIATSLSGESLLLTSSPPLRALLRPPRLDS